MRSLRTLIALVFLFVPTASLIHAQGQPSGDSSQIPTGTGMGATKEEVDELRNEVAAQKKDQPPNATPGFVAKTSSPES